MHPTIFAAFLDELSDGGAEKVARALAHGHTKVAARGHSLAKDFAGGIDPFGTFTSAYGQKAQRRRESEGSHRVRKTVATAGGVVGGAALVPSAIMGVVRGTSAAMAAKGLTKRLAAAGKGFARGVKEPYRDVRAITKLDRAITRAASGKGKTRDIFRSVDKDDIRSLAGKLPIGTAARGLREATKKSGSLTPRGMAKKLQPSVRSARNQAYAGAGLSGGVGGAGAAIQYDKGREAEQGFQKRLAKAKRRR